MEKMAYNDYYTKQGNLLKEKCKKYGPILENKEIQLNRIFISVGIVSVIAAGFAAAFALMKETDIYAAIAAGIAAIASACTTYFNPGKNAALCQKAKSAFEKLSEDIGEFLNDIVEKKIEEKQIKEEFEKLQKEYKEIEDQLPAGIREPPTTQTQ